MRHRPSPPTEQLIATVAPPHPAGVNDREHLGPKTIANHLTLVTTMLRGTFLASKRCLVALLLSACVPARSVDLEPQDDRYQACARRGTERAEGDEVSFAATLLRIDDATPVDGPVNLIAVRGDGQPVKLVFGSLYTRPSPTPGRNATYQVIARSRENDCVQVTGTRMSDGKIWIVGFVNLDRH